MKVKRKSVRSQLRRQKEYDRNRVQSSTKDNNIQIDNDLVASSSNSDIMFKNIIDFVVDSAVQESDEYNYNIEPDSDVWQDVFENLYITNHDIPEETNNLHKPNKNLKPTKLAKGILLPNFDIVLENSSIKRMKKFDLECAKVTWYTCKNCRRSFPELHLTNEICNICVKHPLRWTSSNAMNPGIVPPELSNLTDIEKMVIAKVHTVMVIRRYKGNQHIYSGNIINFPQNISNYVNILPHIPSNIPYILVFHRTFQKGIIKCVARPNIIRTALMWLKTNNKWYHDIEISEENLSLYPIDGDISNQINNINLHFDDEEEIIVEQNLNSFVPDFHSLPQEEAIRKKLNLPYPDIENTPINEFEKDGHISKAFPTLFPFGTGDYSDFHADDNFSFLDYIKFLMQYEDRRFAQDYRLRYYLYNTHLRHQLLSQSKVYIKRGQWDESNAEKFKNAIKEDPKILDSIVAFNKGIKGSQPYWKTRCRELMSMCEQLGPPNIFFTLSAADYRWPDLFKVIAPNQPYESLSEKDRADLMHNNPLITSYYFQLRVKLFMQHVIKPIFKVSDEYYRFEWQHRGSTHVHGVLWIDDAPNFNEFDYNALDLQEMTEYFQTMVFAMNPNITFDDNNHPSERRFSDVNPDYYEIDLKQLVNRLQRHTICGSHCLRRNKITKRISCRYNFPCELRDIPVINDEDGYLRYHPKRNDPEVQRYSNIILQSWRANHDFSPVCSSVAVVQYIVKYLLKAEQKSKVYSSLMSNLSIIDSNSKIGSIISHIFIKSICDRDISAQEVCHLIMGWPLVHSSRIFVNLNLYEDNYDSLEIKGSKLSIKKSELIEKYCNRPPNLHNVNLENITLLTFCQNYDAKNNKYYKHKKFRIVRIIPSTKYIIGEKNNEPYYRQQCLINIPFRCEPSTLLEKYMHLGINKWIDLYNYKKLNEDNDYIFEDIPDDDHEDLPPLDDGLRQTIADINSGIGHHVNKQTIGKRLMDTTFDWSEAQHKYPMLTDVMKFLENYKDDDLNVATNYPVNLKLSDEQQKILNILDVQIECVKKVDYNNKTIIKQCLIQGKAGSGKSTLISEIVKKVKKELNINVIKVCAPTGAAAININGSTIHSEFKLPNDASNTNALVGKAAKSFESNMKSVKFIIIDEMSMIGATRLWQLHSRLCEYSTKNDEPFGGFFIYFFGDFRQLPPVQDTPLYFNTSKSVNSMKGLKLFQSIKNRFELKSTYRQAEDLRFAELVDRLGLGKMTESDYNLLSTRNIHMLSSTEIKSFEDAVHLCSTNNNVLTANYSHLESLNQPIAEILAENLPKVKLRSNEEESGGLPPSLYISIGSRIMLTRNLWTKAGLVNGALGNVTAIIYDGDDKPPCLPSYILVKFDKYYGKTFINDSVPIIPATAYWTCSGIDCYRKQFPLILSYANSIHKGQGLTIPKVIIDIGNTEFSCGITYVAITRARKLSDIIFKPFFSLKRFMSIKNSKVMSQRVDFIKSFSE